MRPGLLKGMWTGFMVVVLAAPLAARGDGPLGDVPDSFFRYTNKENRPFFSQMPGETVDPFTGTLRIVQTDLVLPGKGGLDLSIVRSYSSKIWGRADLLDTEPLLAEKENSVLGYGWTFHFGRLKNPNATGLSNLCSGDFPVYEEPDGSAHVFYQATPGNSSVFVSKDYWRMEKNCAALGGGGTGACVWSNTGLRYEMSSSFDNQYFVGTQPVWPASGIVDPFGNRISVSYLPQTGAPSSVTDTYSRTITFSYIDGVDGKRLDTMTANGKDYRYFYTTYTPERTGGAGRLPLPGPRRFLTEVKPPVGPSDFYQYATNSPVQQNQYALATITYPSGGTTSYAYASVPFFTGLETVSFSVVVLRTVGGRGVTGGEWSYEYSSPGYLTSSSTDPATGLPTDMHVTSITRPDGLQDTYTMYGFGWVADQNRFGYTYAVGLTKEAARANRAEIEVFEWDGRFDAPVSPQTTYSAPVYSTNCQAHFIADGAVYAPTVKHHWIVRDGGTYLTESGDFDAYGQPRNVLETGYQAGIGTQALPPASRATTWTYFSAPVDGSGATLNMVRGKPRTQHVCIGTDCFNNSWTYNGLGYAKDSETQSGVETTFGYHPDGNLNRVTNALNQSLRLEAYTYGVPTSIDFNGAFNITRTASWEGRTLSETDGRGFGYTTGYGYDAIGRVLRTTPPGDNLATDYTYADDGSWVNLTRGTYSKTTNVDGLGRETSSLDSENVITSAKYDAMGRAWFKSYPYDATGGEVGEKLEFDGLSRVITATKAYRSETGICDAPGACQVTSVYYGNCIQTSAERALGDTTITWHCNTSYGDPGEGRLTQVSDAAGSLWEYAYNSVGKLLNVNAPLSQGDRSYFYDGRQFLTSESSGERGTIGYGRNAIGQMTSKGDERPVTVSYDYTDPLSRLKKVSYPHSSDDVTQGYDNANNVIRASSENGGAFDYVYDELNRVVSQTWTYGEQTYITSFHYNQAGCLDTMTYPTGTALSMTCDSANRVKSVKVGSDVIVKDVIYHPSGQVASMTYGNGKTTLVTYDDRARTVGVAAADVIDLAYGYDGADNVRSFENRAVTGSARTMTYDALDRLETTTAPGLWGEAYYQYDALGNRTYKSVGGAATTFAYDAQNRFASASTNILPNGSMAFTWDDASRMVAFSDGATYRYDGHDRRIEKAEATQTTVYHYSPAGQVIAETLPDGTRLRDYLYLGNKLIAVDGCVGGVPPNCAVERQWYHTDTLGSVLARTDSAGTVWARLDYEPWGEEYSQTGVPGDRQYNGRVYDPGTGFHDYGARLYWPQVGRFVSADTFGGHIANPQSLNRYAYVTNNPYRFTDPTGHQEEEDEEARREPGTLTSPELRAETGVWSNLSPVETYEHYMEVWAQYERAPGTMRSEGWVPRAEDAEWARSGAEAAQGRAEAREAESKLGSSGGPGAGKRFPESVKDAAEAEAGSKCVFCGKSTTREPGPTRRNADPLSANMDETASPGEFSVEGRAWIST